MGREVIEIKSPGRTIDHGQTKQQQCTGEKSCQNVFGTCFGRVVTVFIEGNQCCHRNRSCFKTDEEHQEMSGGNHEIHTKQGRECKHIEFSLFEWSVFSFHPLVRHQENNQCTDIQDRFNNCVHRYIVIHTTECIGSSSRNQVDSRMDSHQNNGQHSVQACFPTIFVCIRTHEEVS